MTVITPEDIDRLITLESEVNYDKPPLDGGEPLKVVENESPVLISAPHGARTFRNSREQIWHEEDEYTAGMALLLGELCEVTVIATNSRNDRYDPNFAVDSDVPYKKKLGDLIRKHHIHFVIDLHGAAMNSVKLDKEQTIDLGLRQNEKNQLPSMGITHVEKLEGLLATTDAACDPSCFVVGRNRLPGAGDGTVITYAISQTVPGTDRKVQAIQIEMKPQVRIANRFLTATLYKSCGPYHARVENVMHMLQSLANFIDYLKNVPYCSR